MSLNILFKMFLVFSEVTGERRSSDTLYLIIQDIDSENSWKFMESMSMIRLLTSILTRFSCEVFFLILV